jgi:pre-rRNA-processing protein TSR3
MAALATILRHPAENLAKCSVEPLRGRADLEFVAAEGPAVVRGDGCILLEVGAPPLTMADAGRRLILLDGNWKHVPRLRARVTGNPLPRSLPPVPTAYPRRNAEGADPAEGLATVEALYLALRILGVDDPTLLAHYRWRQAFLRNVGATLGGG